jgi:type IV secretory pathway VirB10-like protein
MVQKAEVEIQEKPKTPQQEALEKVLKSMEVPVQPPPIEETLEKAKLAQAQAQKAKVKPQRVTWYCTDCGAAHIQNDGAGITPHGDHIQVDVIDGEYVDRNGNPLTGTDLELMKKYAEPKATRGQGHMGAANRITVQKMKEHK